MHNRLRLLELFEGKRYQKVVLAVSVVSFLILELLIFMAAAGQSGEKSRVYLLDAQGRKVYETSGSTLTSYEKMVFENTFGAIDKYTIQIHNEFLPFPFRAWLSAAIGVPVGLVLLMAFLVKAYLTLLYGDPSEQHEEPAVSTAGRFSMAFSSFRSFSIFHLGFVAFVAVLLLWMVPNLVGDFAKITVSAIREYQWFFLGAALFFAFLILWVVYLRYRLSQRMLENQLDLEKYRVEKQLLLQQREPTPLLPNPVNEVQES